MATLLTIDRRQGLTCREFVAEYVSQNKPVILVGCPIAGWKASRRWRTAAGRPNFARLKEDFGVLPLTL